MPDQIQTDGHWPLGAKFPEFPVSVIACECGAKPRKMAARHSMQHVWHQTHRRTLKLQPVEYAWPEERYMEGLSDGDLVQVRNAQVDQRRMGADLMSKTPLADLSKTPLAELVTPEYRKNYERGWRYSMTSSDPTLDHLDRKAGATEAEYDGYLDAAASREKWHIPRCPNHDAGGCGQ